MASKNDGDPVAAPPIEPTRERPGSLTLLNDREPLGRGGMAVVQQAIDDELGRVVAYKQLNDELVQNDLARRAFITEAQVTSQLDHPHIVPIYELGRHADSSLYFTMKKVQGKTLAEILASQPAARRTQEQLFALTQVFAKVCDAVAFAHDRGVIHRDLKPDNIMVGDFGQVYVLDWGIALTRGAPALESRPDRPNRVMGTPLYMSPEQAGGHNDQIDERSDIFALGACLYEILTGVGPYSAPEDTTMETLAKAYQCEVMHPQERVSFDLPAQLCRVAMKAMNKIPAQRFQTVHALKLEVERFLQTYSFFPRVTFEAGSSMVREGDQADEIYVLVEGEAEVVRADAGGETLVRHLRSGDVFGEVAVFANRTRTATVRALTEVTAVRISREQMSRDNEIGYWFNLFTKAIAERFLEKERQIAALEHRLERLTRKPDLDG